MDIGKPLIEYHAIDIAALRRGMLTQSAQFWERDQVSRTVFAGDRPGGAVYFYNDNPTDADAINTTIDGTTFQDITQKGIYTETLMGFYQRGRNEGGTFDAGVEMALRRVLSDPEFIFRREAEPASLADGKTYRISDIELASRLSFFIWSSIPDEALLKVAQSGTLRQPAVLEAQVRRMLKDPRSSALVENFAGQWLGIRAIQTQVPVAGIFPDFDDNLRNAMRKEMELFVGNMIQNDRPVTELLDANYTFVNERLAKHYGIKNVYGSYFRRVELPAELSYRKGLLGKALLMTISSQPGRTSPVQRGKTVMQTFLGVEPPAPPPSGPERPPCGNRWKCTARTNRAPAATKSWTRSASRSRISMRPELGATSMVPSPSMPPEPSWTARCSREPTSCAEPW